MFTAHMVVKDRHEVDELDFGQKLQNAFAELFGAAADRVSVVCVDVMAELLDGQGTRVKVDIRVNGPTQQEMKAYDNRPNPWKDAERPKDAAKCVELSKGDAFELKIRQNKFLFSHQANVIRRFLVDPSTEEQRKNSARQVVNALVFLKEK
jgi:hypothetical protein